MLHAYLVAYPFLVKILNFQGESYNISIIFNIDLHIGLLKTSKNIRYLKSSKNNVIFYAII